MNILKFILSKFFYYLFKAIKDLIICAVAIILLILPMIILCNLITNPFTVLLVGIPIGILLMLMFINLLTI